MCIDELRFEAAKNRVIGINRERQGIGTLSEKTVHAVLKNYYAPDTDMHEIPIENFVADIFTGTEIIEIQTRSFQVMRRKLDAFLKIYPVRMSNGFRGSMRRVARCHRSASPPKKEIRMWHLKNCIKYVRF